jgi:hypothetical protein
MTENRVLDEELSSLENAMADLSKASRLWPTGHIYRNSADEVLWVVPELIAELRELRRLMEQDDTK